MCVYVFYPCISRLAMAVHAMYAPAIAAARAAAAAAVAVSQQIPYAVDTAGLQPQDDGSPYHGIRSAIFQQLKPVLVSHLQ